MLARKFHSEKYNEVGYYIQNNIILHWKTEKYNLGKKLWGWNVYYNKRSAIKFIKFLTEGIDDDVTFDKRSSE